MIWGDHDLISNPKELCQFPTSKVKILNISNICTISIIFHDFVSATQRDEIEINAEMGALIFLRCGKNWFRRGRRGGRSLQPECDLERIRDREA